MPENKLDEAYFAYCRTMAMTDLSEEQVLEQIGKKFGRESILAVMRKKLSVSPNSLASKRMNAMLNGV